MNARRLEWSEEIGRSIDRLLERAHGRRQTRLLTHDQVRACVDEALRAPLQFGWRHAGEVPDPRGPTTLVLAVLTAGGVVVGIAECRAQEPNPSRGFRAIAQWDRYDDAVNAAAVQRWASSVTLGEATVLVPFAAQAAPTHDRDALFEAMRARPDEDEPRLVYADFLSEQGDPRGEFIALQCERATLERGSVRALDLEAREAVLLDEHRAAWVADLPPGVEVTRFERGFAAALRVLSPADVPGLAAFAERELVSSLVVTNPNPNPSVFAATPWVAQLRALSFWNVNSRGGLTAGPLEALLTSRYLRGLEALSFRGHSLKDEGATVLAQGVGAALPRLRSLALEGDALTPLGMNALAETRWLGTLDAACFSHNPTLGPQGLEALVNARSPGRLTSLLLEDVHARNDGALIIAGAARLKTLRVLDLSRNRLTQVGASALLHSPWLAGLQRLTLAGNQLNAELRAQLERRNAR